MLHCTQLKRLFHDCYNTFISNEHELKHTSLTIRQELLLESKKYNCILLSKEIRKMCNYDIPD